jgi:hypothetical protein
VLEEPQPTGQYAAGADWAKENDTTVIVVARVDETLWRNVYLRAVNRKPWPHIAARTRAELLVRYINAVEKRKYRLPANTPKFDAHKGTTVDEAYAPGK